MDYPVLILAGISLSTVALVGAMMYNNYRERRKVEVLRGILTDALMSLKASNNYIEAIFSCYKDLIKYFRMRGAMKKVFETTREFEDVINNMLGGIVPQRRSTPSSRYSRRPLLRSRHRIGGEGQGDTDIPVDDW